MIKTVVKALEGFEKQFEEVSAKKAQLDEEKANAKELALAKVDADFAEKARIIDNVLELLSETEEIEVPDEPVEVAEEVNAAENTEEVTEVEVQATEESF